MGFTKMDILVVVDHSTFSPEALEVVAEQISDIVGGLIGREFTEVSDLWVPQEDLHLAVIDGGGDGLPVMAGDACTLETRAHGCPSGDCSYLDYLAELRSDGCELEPSSIAEDAACLVRALSARSEGGQPLESLRRFLALHTRGGGVAEGFLREGSALMILIVSAGDDQSHSAWGAPIAVEIYRELFGELIRERGERRILLSLVAGLPDDETLWSLGDPLSELRALEGETTCESSRFRGTAPVRLMEVLYSVGFMGIAQSICDSDWSWSAVLGRIGFILPGTYYAPRCPMATLEQPGPCRLVETMPDDGPCPQDVDRTAERACGPGWHRDLGLDTEGRRRCEILPSDRDGDGHPDLVPDASPGTSCLDDSVEGRDLSGCIPGWYVVGRATWPDFEGFERDIIDFTWGSPEVGMSPRAVLRLECEECVVERR